MTFSSQLDFELDQLRRDHAQVRLELEQYKRDCYARKYSPDQPHVPGGSPDGGRWAGGNGGKLTLPGMSLAYLGPSRFVVQKAVEAGLTLFTWLSSLNAFDKQAVIAFNARGFQVGESGELDLINVQRLDRDQVDAACPRLGEVQGTGRIWPLRPSEAKAEFCRRNNSGQPCIRI